MKGRWKLQGWAGCAALALAWIMGWASVAAGQELKLPEPVLGRGVDGEEGSPPRTGLVPRLTAEMVEPGEGGEGGALGGGEGSQQAEGGEAEGDGEEAEEDDEGRRRRDIKNGLYVLFFYEHDPTDDETLFHLLGLYWYRDKPDWQLHSIVPLFAYWNWKGQEDKWGLATPLVWHSNGPEHTYTGAWLWHRWRSPQTRFDALAPLFWHHYDVLEDDDLYILGPAWWRARQAETTFGVLPIFWGSSGPGHADWTLFPLLSWERDAEGTSLLSPAFFSTWDAQTDETFGGIPPLLTFWSYDDERTSWGFPLAYYSGGPSDAFVLTPLFYSSLNYATEEHSGGILPLLTFWKTTPDDFTIGQFPLFFHYEDDESEFNMVTPLMIGYEGRDWQLSTFIPIYFGVDTDTTEFVLVLPALYARFSEPGYDFGMLGPLYAYRDGEERGFGLWPILGSYEDGAGVTETWLFPIYYGAETGVSRHHWFLPFLYGRSEWESGDSVSITGPLWATQLGDDAMRGLFPVVWVHEDPSEQEHTTVVAPVYYAHDDARLTQRGFLPLLYWRSEDLELDTEALIAGPAYYLRDQEDERWGLLPLYFGGSLPSEETYYQVIPGLWTRLKTPGLELDHVVTGYRYETPAEESWGLLPLGAWRRDKIEGSFEVGVAPGVYFAQGPERFQLHVGPAWYSQRGEMQSVGLFPAFIHHHEGDGSAFTWAPGFLEIVKEDGEGEEGWDFTYLLTGFRYHNDQDFTATLVAPLFLEAHDERSGDWWALAPPWVFVSGNTQRDERLIFAPPFFTASTPTESGWMLFPLGFGHENAHRSFWLVAPLALGWADHDEGTSFVMGPGVFGRYQRGDVSRIGQPGAESGPYASDTGWLGPFVWSDSTRGHFRLLFPLVLDWADVEARSEFYSFFPIYWQWKSEVEGVKRRVDAVAPLFVRYTEEVPGQEPESFTTIGPAFWYGGEVGGGFGLAPLFWHDREVLSDGKARGHDFVFPLYWRWFDEQEERRRLIAGPLYSFVDGSKERYGIFPFYLEASERDAEGRESGYSTIPPLFWRGYGVDASGVEEDTLLTPVGVRHRRGEDEWSLFLNVYHEIEQGVESDVVFPLLYRSRSEVHETLAIAPLFWTTEDPSWSATLVFPFYFRSEDRIAGEETIWAFPYLGLVSGEREVDAVVPVFYQERWADGSLLRLAAPGFVQWEDGPSGDQLVLAGPVWYAGAGEGGYDTGVFPLLWWGEEANGIDGYTVGFPLFWRFVGDQGEDTLTIVGPGWYHGHREGWSLGLAPLAFAQVDRAEEAFRLGIVPVWYSQVRGESTLVAFPFWAQQWTETSRWALGPGFYHSSDDLARTSTTVAGPYIDIVDGETWTGGLLPFYFGHRGQDGSTLDTVAGLAWWWDDGPGTDEGGAIIGPGYHWKDDEGSVTGLFPIGHLRLNDDGGGEGWLLPLGYWSESADHKEETWIAGPAWYHRDDLEQEELWGVAPLVWSFETAHSSGSAVFPAYYHQSRDDGHTFVSPLFYSHREGDQFRQWSWLYTGWGDAEASYRAVLPVYFGSRHADGSRVDVVLPLFAHVEGAGGETGWTAAPLYFHTWDVRDQTSARVLFPLYWDFEGKKRDLTIVGLWWRSKRNDVERVSHGLIPLYYYTEDKKGYTFELLGGVLSVDHNYKRDESEVEVLWIPL